MRWYRAHLLARRKLWLWPWLAAAFVCAFAGVGAVSARPTTCSTWYPDPESSALLADVVLEGRLREKSFPTDRVPATPGTGWYNVTVQVRKDILKGGDLVNEGKKVSKLLIGKFLRRENGVVSNEVSVRGGGAAGGDDGGGAGTGENDMDERDWSDCVMDLEDGATYIFFLRNVGKERGKYFEISALPVKKNRRESRLITKIIKSGGQKPSVQSIHGSKKVTVGSSLTLRCKAKAKPNPNYIWYRNGKELKSGKGVSIKNNKRGSRLKISKTQTEDDGVYECVADNALGTARKNVTVEVKKRIVLYGLFPDYGYMNEEANGSHDYVSAPQKIYKACEKQTFCFNGGTCRYIPELHQTFCECPAEWAGQRCELLDNLSVQDKYSRQSTLLYERTLIIFGIVIAVLVFLVICIASYFLANRRRKRSEANKRKMKRDGDPESDRLLPDKAEASSKGQHAPNYSPSTHQATQTEADAHLPNPLTKFTSNANSNFLHLDRTFPMVSSVVTAPVAAPPILANGQRSGHRTPDRDPLERREPRHRLKAAPEDDNVTETRTPVVGVTAPITTGGNSPEIVELTATGPDPTDQRRFLGPEHEKQGGWAPETFSSLIPFTEMSEPVRMEVRPTANVYAQMKPLPKAPNAPNTILHTPPSKDAPNTVKVVDVSFPDTPPMNGVLIGDSDNEGESVTSPQLPLLHISEEDLTRNVHKPQKPFPGGGLSSPSAPPTVSLTPASPARALEPRPESFPSQFPVGVRAPPNSSSLSDEDSGGFSVRNLSGSEATSPTYFSSAATARPYHYAFDPTADSDPSELLDEFMHVPPNTYLAGGLDDRRELRLRDVRDNQEAIPI